MRVELLLKLKFPLINFYMWGVLIINLISILRLLIRHELQIEKKNNSSVCLHIT